MFRKNPYHLTVQKQQEIKIGLHLPKKKKNTQSNSLIYAKTKKTNK